MSNLIQQVFLIHYVEMWEEPLEKQKEINVEVPALNEDVNREGRKRQRVLFDINPPELWTYVHALSF